MLLVSQDKVQTHQFDFDRIGRTSKIPRGRWRKCQKQQRLGQAEPRNSWFRDAIAGGTPPNNLVL